MPLTYTSYLKISELLSLQVVRSEPEEHDEMLFIIIHQAYELWFKEILHELDYCSRLLQEGDLIRASHTMKRILTILKVIVHQVDILETMTPLEFLSFREYLETASGFQSIQFRELEFVLGAKNPNSISRFPENSPERNKLMKRLNEPSLWDVFMRYIKAKGYPIPSEYLERYLSKPVLPSDEIQTVLIEIYKSDSDISQFCELLVDLDEGLQEWRYRHVKMVERTIGTKPGTGGSPGVKYLRGTLFNPLFPDLWEIRSFFNKY